MQRKSYLNDDVLKEVAGRLRFGASDIEDKLNTVAKPEPKPWVYPTHPLDNVASEFGMRGFEFKVLQEAAIREMPNHALLQHYYRRFLMAAKLVLDGELEAARQHERRLSEERNARDSTYQHRLKEWNSRRQGLMKQWTGVRETIRTRWRRIGKSIATMLESNATLKSMADRDAVFIEEMARRGIAAIDRSDGAVIHFNWDRYADMSIEDINEVIQLLDADPSGNFIAKAVVGPLNEA